MPNFAVIVRVAGLDLDKCSVALPIQIAHGRSTTDSQPDAPVCTFTYLGEVAPGALGDLVEVEVAGVSEGKWSDPDVLWTDVNVSWTGLVGRSLRFTGTITKVVATETANKITGWDVEATGHQARLGFEPIDIARPQETDVDRVQAIATAAGIPIEVIGAAGPTLVADAINRDALSALHEVCASSGGILWQQRDGTITYGTMYRHLSVPQWRLICDMVLDGIEWTRDAGPVLNHVTISRKVGEGTEQDTFRDDDSIAEWGFRHTDLNTLCASAADSNLLATALLARRRQPRWVMPGVVVLREKSTDSAWVPMAQLDFGHTVLIDVETDPTPTPGAMTPWTVEGWVETWEPTGRRVQLAVSEHNLGTPILWADADDQNWEHWATTTSWLEALVEA